jgi:two-component system, OmpR family, alkaline phosphatase synthesis response regulator PhoP
MGKRVLIVDDDVNVREDLKLPLLMRGYEVFEASNGQEGLELARGKKPQVILQDLLISKVDGFRVARLLKFDERFKDIIMIAITQLGRQETQDEARRMGFDFYMTKPLDPERVADKLDQVFLSIDPERR